MLLYKYRSIERFEYLLDILLNQRLFCPEYRNLNDPFEGIFYSRLPRPVHFRAGDPVGQPLRKWKEIKVIDDQILNVSKMRICSLSKSLSDVRLWSLYASGHKGVVIEIDFKGHNNDYKEVQYKNELPEFGNAVSTSTSALEALSVKSEHWSYEQECRIIQGEEWYGIEGRIRRVLVGARTSEDQIEILRKIAPPPIEVKRVTLTYSPVGIDA